jgi:hypothetical protein
VDRRAVGSLDGGTQQAQQVAEGSKISFSPTVVTPMTSDGTAGTTGTKSNIPSHVDRHRTRRLRAVRHRDYQERQAGLERHVRGDRERGQHGQRPDSVQRISA